MGTVIRSIEYHLPERVVTNADLAREFPEWGVERISKKTGFDARHVAGENECSSDLAVAAAQKLFESGVCRPRDVDFLLLCTQSPDYLLPTTACLIQDRLGLPTQAGALDFNLGCSGFIYGLSLSHGLIETGQARTVLLITAETYTSLLDPADKVCRTIFGDAAAATLLCSENVEAASVGPFSFGTDGSGAANLILRNGGMRESRSGRYAAGSQEVGLMSKFLFMNGAEIFTFTLRVVPPLVDDLLARAGLSLSEIDLFVFHQANRFILEHLRDKLGIPAEKFVMNSSERGNTVSSTIPIALKDAQREGVLRAGQRVMVVGFGVGYSWGATILRWAGPTGQQIPSNGLD